MATQEQLNDYAKRLPDIYRDILSAYPNLEPRRKAGYGMAFQTLAAHFYNVQKQWSFGDVEAACKQLADGGLVEIKNRIFAHPTELGEQLITILTGKPASSNGTIPPLPPPPSR